MINLSEHYLKSPRPSLVDKITTYFEPDFYLAESITDFKEQRQSIVVPMHKKVMPKQMQNGPSYYVLMYNLGIEMHQEDNNYFILHDNTGTLIALWHNEQNRPLRSEYSFERAQQEQNLQHQDHVHQICLHYIKNIDLPIIADIKKKSDPPNPEIVQEPRTKKIVSSIQLPTWKPSFV